MSISVRATLASGLMIGCLVAPQTTHAATVIVGNELARGCYLAAHEVEVYGTVRRTLSGPTGTRLALDPIGYCTAAFESFGMSARDTAGTFVNRGVLHHAENSYDLALADFDAAIGLDERLAEAHVDRGLTLIATERWADSIAAFNRGIALQADQPARVYYYRGVAFEEVENLRGAYDDYVKASELSPEWDEPRLQLARFTVVTRAQPND